LLVFCAGATAQISSSKDTVYRVEEINVISTRTGSTVFTSPTSIKIIDEKQILSVNGDRLSDVLKTSGNIFLKSYGNNASLSTISLNGLGAEHTLILIDGKKQNSFQNSQTDLNLLPKDKIEKIEILNNGSSSIYGSNAIGGVVNIITKNEKTDKIKARVSGSYGSYGYGKFGLNIINSNGKLNYDLYYFKEKSEDNFKYYYNDGKSKTEKERNNNKFDADNIFLNLNYRIGKRSELRLNSGYFAQTRKNPGIETGTPPSASEQVDKNWNSNLIYNFKWDDKLIISSEINYQNNLMKYTEPGLSDSYYKNFVVSNNTSISIRNNFLKNTSGIEYTNAGINGSSFSGNITRKQYSIYSANELSVTDKIKLFPSARIDYMSDLRKNVITGKIGINYRPFDRYSLNLRASAGNNFSAPTFNELYWQNIGNRNLSPEKSINFDAGIIYRFIAIAENIVELNYTKIKIEDKIVWKPAEYGFWRPYNIDKSESNIISFNLNSKLKMAKHLDVGFSYNYTYNKTTKESSDYPGDESLGKQIFYIPVEISKMNFEADYKGITLNIFYSFTGRRYSDYANKNRLPVIDLLDGNIGYTFNVNKIKVSTKLEINNLLNEDYQVMPGYPMPLRNFKINLSISY
jgi:iron complex outermembrane receptor protein